MDQLQLPDHMKQMIATQSELKQLYSDQQKQKRIKHNKEIQEKKYYGNSVEYWNKWHKIGAHVYF